MPLSEMDKPAATSLSAERQEAIKLYSSIAVHVADVMDLLPLLNHLARLENQRAPSAEIERARRKLTTTAAVSQHGSIEFSCRDRM